jgi:hypothetical protein
VCFCSFLRISHARPSFSSPWSFSSTSPMQLGGPRFSMDIPVHYSHAFTWEVLVQLPNPAPFNNWLLGFWRKGEWISGYSQTLNH